MIRSYPIKTAFVLWILFIVPFLFACKAKQNTVKEQGTTAAHKDTIVISFERTACFGKCPTFKADFYESGKVFYHGIEFVENKGHFQGKIEEEILEGIYQKAKEIGFFGMNDKYDGNITDVPSQLYFIAMHGEEQNIFARYKTPPELKTLGDHIDKVLAGITWLPVEDQDH